jgi:multiple sugar transport system permease protein
VAQVSGNVATDPALAGINPLQTGVASATAVGRRATTARRENLVAYLFLAPAILVLGVFQFFPLFFSFYISLHNWRIKKAEFLGFANYGEALRKRELWLAFGNTVYYVIGTVPITMALALLFAYLLFQKVRFLSFFRTVYFLPYVTSSVAAAAIWVWIFNARTGILNQFLSRYNSQLRWLQEPKGIFAMLASHFGITLPTILSGPSLALVAIMVVASWHLIGFDIVIFLAGLGNVNKELYEAARIDGAGEWAIFRRITLPLLGPTISFLAIISTIGAFKAFNEIYVMSTAVGGNSSKAGDPLGSTQTVVVYVYNQFYTSHRLGYGSAVAFLLFIVIFSLTMGQMWLGRRRGAV